VGSFSCPPTLGYPIPGIVLVQQEDKSYLVLDGQQRLKTFFMSADKCVPYVRPAGLKVDWFNPSIAHHSFRSSPAVSTGRWSATRAICGLTVHSAGGIRPSNNGMARFQFLQRQRVDRLPYIEVIPGTTSSLVRLQKNCSKRNRCDALRMTEYTN
jgi:hypothetical protein